MRIIEGRRGRELNGIGKGGLAEWYREGRVDCKREVSIIFLT